MLQNYLKIALRNLLRQKTFSFINIFGLALSMSICLLIIMLVKDAYNYDKFHPESDRIFRVLTEAQRKNGGTEGYATSPYMLGKTLQDEYSAVELWTPLMRRFNSEMRAGEKSFNFDGLLSDRSFFEMFGFELAMGDPETALNEPYAVVLTNELAGRMFQGQNPVGKTVQIPGYASDFTVTGVMKPFPGKTHLEFTALGSLATQLAEEKLPGNNNRSGDWRDYYGSYNFVRLKGQTGKSAVEQALATLAKTQYADLELESRDAGYRFGLQPLNEITPSMPLSNSMGNGMPVFLVWFLTILGAIIMLSACFNYTNLTIARSLVRTREVGVRKVLGASRRQVFGQFIGEAIVTSLLALALAYPFYHALKPQFGQLSISELLDIQIREDLSLYALFLAFALAVGLIAGLLPALTLSKTRPVAILQKLQNIKLIQRVGLRKALLTVQFTVTLILLTIMTIVWRQGEHAISVNFGFDQPHTLLVQLQGQPFDKAAAALGQISGVEELSGISHPMGTWLDGSDDVRTEKNAEKVGVRDYFIDHNYLGHFNLKLVAGENFPENPAQQKELFVLVNETFVRQFNLGGPAEAIGKPILIGDSLQVAIRGVLADFPFKPAVYAMEPLMLRYDPDQLDVLNLRLAGKETPATMAALERAWKKLGTDDPFEATFFDQTVRNNFSNALDLARLVGFFGLMGMLIACLGLLGMAIYTVQTREKEIGIRKVVGASMTDLVFLLSKGYLLLFGLAVAIATPLSFLLGTQMLQMFEDRIDLSPGVFLPAILSLLTVAGLAVGSQTVRAAMRTPVNALRSE